MKVLEGQLDGLLDTVQERLPEPAGEALARARRSATDARRAATEAGEKADGSGPQLGRLNLVTPGHRGLAADPAMRSRPPRPNAGDH